MNPLANIVLLCIMTFGQFDIGNSALGDSVAGVSVLGR